MRRLLDTRNINRREWEIHLCETHNGNRFIVAKQKTIYNRVIEVKLYTMYDGMQIATPDNPRDLVDSDVLATLKRAMVQLAQIYC